MSSQGGGQPRIAYLGPVGTFTEEAALRYRPHAELLPMITVAAVASAVDSDTADEGVVPIENSLEGTVTATVDTLIHESRLAIRGEIILPIDHCLLVRPGQSAESVQVIYSHPQALGQCRRFLERSFLEARQEASLSTAAAVEQMMQAENAAAVGTQRAAELYGAEVLERAIQDNPANKTRFAVLGLTDSTPSGADKTSLAFSVAHDRPGTLVSVLHEFSDRDINLTKIESRPSKEELGIYIFLVDLEGHRSEPIVAEALAAVREKAFFFKVFGSYPRYQDA